jgi:hypothetical protein
MAKKIKRQDKKSGQFLFEKRNYIIMSIGIVVILLGFILMVGGGSDDPLVFNESIYNFQRIRLAPTIVLIGLAIEVYAIMANPVKKNK